MFYVFALIFLGFVSIHVRLERRGARAPAAPAPDPELAAVAEQLAAVLAQARELLDAARATEATPAPAPADDRETDEEATQIRARPVMPAIPPTADELAVLEALGKLEERACMVDVATPERAGRLLRIGRAVKRETPEIVAALAGVTADDVENLDRGELAALLASRVVGLDERLPGEGETRTAQLPEAG